MTEASTNVTFFSGLLQTVADRGRALVGYRRAAPPSVAGLLGLAQKLVAGRGEASAMALAASILVGYGALAPPQRLEFLTGAAKRFGPDLDALAAAAQAFLANPDEGEAAKLMKTAEPRRQELLRRLNHAPGGTLALVRMREDMIGALSDSPALTALDADFVHLFTSWFNRGFLVLRRIDWTTPANILEKIIRYEAVHAIQGWDDLRRRLEPPDRRLYAFFHPALGDEPLIFVEVALTDAIPAAIAPLLAPDRAELAPKSATTAVFYSISNAQRGLARVSFGNFLIKQVVEELKREWPRLTNFVTLSPVPGFAAWLRREAADKNSPAISAQARRALALLEKPNWSAKIAAKDAFERTLVPLAAHYFLHARTASGRVVDPVARFHLGNGARLERLNPFGDLSEAALRQSHGLMVNYLYDLDHIEENHEAFANKNEVVASSAVRKLARIKPREIAEAAPESGGVES
ncbi:malonyl-CoA decarboxylase [Methylocapsa sp. S129]|uniref:malonyl-CoA decarboxylase n=1 Tax=Methylocapsa sp. S129 TaxID=1641869 RepID=UPI001FEE8A5A|nr:malonyl-CoA decarboxylase [Methylocapsa sp. S129]